MGRRGKQKFVQVLRLLESFSQEEVQSAVIDAIHLGWTLRISGGMSEGI